MLGWTLYENTLLAWLLAVAAAVLAVVGLWLLGRLLAVRMKRPADRAEAGMHRVVRKTVDATKNWFRLVVGLWAGSLVLVLPPSVRLRIDQATTFALLVQVGIWCATAIATWVEVFSTQKAQHGDGAAVTTMRALGFLARIAVWVIALL